MVIDDLKRGMLVGTVSSVDLLKRFIISTDGMMTKPFHIMFFHFLNNFNDLIENFLTLFK